MMQKSRGHGQNIWTDEQRAVLLLLHTQTSFDSETRTAIFNHIFDNYLKSCGVDSGLTRSVVDGQYRERTRPTRERYWIRSLQIVGSNEDKILRDDLLKRIKSAADTLRNGEAAPTHPKSDASGTGSQTSTSTSHAVEKRQRNRWNGYTDAEADDLEHLTKVQKQNGFDGLGFADWSYGARTRQSRAATEPLSTLGRDPGSQLPEEDIGEAFIGTNLGQDCREGDDESKPEDTDKSPDGEARIQEQLRASASPPAVQLEMLHASRINLKDNQGAVEATGTAFIPHSSVIYKHGGQVHRISYGERDIDVMVCDTKICEVCGEHQDPSAETITDGLPFVHSSDTIRRNNITIFQPRPRRNTGATVEGYLRSVRFITLDGVTRWPVRMCGYVQCRVCSGGEHMRVQENKEEEKRSAMADESDRDKLHDGYD